MEYADYAYYTDSYHGSAVTEQEWPRLSIQASAYLDMITMGRIQRLKEIPDAVKNAVCAVVEIKKAQQLQGNITSEKRTGIMLSPIQHVQKMSWKENSTMLPMNTSLAQGFCMRE